MLRHHFVENLFLPFIWHQQQLNVISQIADVACEFSLQQPCLPSRQKGGTRHLAIDKIFMCGVLMSCKLTSCKLMQVQDDQTKMMFSQQGAKGLDPQQVRSTRGVRCAQHELAHHICEIIKFKLDKAKTQSAGNTLMPSGISSNQEGEEFHQHIERYESIRTDQPEDSNGIDSCWLAVCQSDLDFKVHKMEFEGHEGVFWLNRAEPTESF